MMRVTALACVCSLLALLPARAIENLATGTFNTAVPTNTSIPNWTTGWVQPAVQPTGYASTTGWNYCGSIDGNSAVYLGGGWVLTAAHVGAGQLSLNNVAYPMVPNSAQVLQSVAVPGQAAPTQPQADLVLFRVSPAPALPSLVIRPNDPVAGTSKIAMLGWGEAGGDRAETWGYNALVNFANSSSPPITPINSQVTLQAVVNGVIDTFYSNDFVTPTQQGSGNDYQVITGDSGGPDFIFNSSTKAWELAGINETMFSNNGSAPYFSGMVQLDTYLPQINSIMSPATDSPTLPAWGMGVMAVSLATAAVLPLATRAHLASKASSRG